MKLPVYQQWSGPRPKSGLLAVVVQLISLVESAIFKTRPTQRPRNLDTNFTGRRFTWRKRDIKERRMPESRVAPYLYGQQSWIIGPLLPSSKDLLAISPKLLLQCFWPQRWEFCLKKSWVHTDILHRYTVLTVTSMGCDTVHLHGSKNKTRDFHSRKLAWNSQKLLLSLSKQ